MPTPKLIAALIAIAALPLPTLAQEERTGFSIGLGAGFSTDPYIGDNDTVGAVPILSYQGRGFEIGTGGLEVDLMQRPNLSIEGLVSPRFSALDDPDAAELAGIDRDLTVDAGLRLSYALSENVDVTASVLQELTGEHDGQEVTLGLENSLTFGSLPVTLGVGASWKSSDLSSYLYGVTPGEARAGRPSYDPSASLSPYISLSTGIPLSQRVMLIGSVQAEFFDDEIKDSPIVDKDMVVGGFAGLVYGF